MIYHGASVARAAQRAFVVCDMPWRILSPRNIGFIGHVARYAPSSTYVSERNTAPIHIN